MKKFYLKPPLLLCLLMFGWCNIPLYGQSLASIDLPNSESNWQKETITVEQALQSLEEEFEVSFHYETDVVKNIRLEKAVENTENKDFQELLGELLDPTGLSFRKLNDQYYLIIRNNSPKKILRQNVKESIKDLNLIDAVHPLVRRDPNTSFNQPLEQTISGQVTDGESGEPLPGVNVLAKGTTSGTVTDISGSYRLSVNDDVNTLVYSSIGYATKEIKINGRNTINLELMPDVQALSEVVVVGYGTQESRNVVGAIAQTDAEELGVDKRPLTNVQSALVGSVPGVRAINASGAPGSTPNIRVRGISTLGTNANGQIVPSERNALVIIDGFEGSLADVNPQEIESVSILKDASAVAIYGVRGANGVVLVTTKNTRKGERVGVSYNFNYGIQTQRPVPGTLESLNLMQFENFAVTGDPTGGGDPAAPYAPSDLDLARSGFYPETIWPEELYDNSSQQSHNLTITGGSEKTGYYINTSFLNQDGLVIGNDNFQRVNLRLKVDTDITDWLSIGTNSLITNRVTNQTPANGGNGLLGSPFFPVKSVDGFWVDKGSPGEPNPIAQAASGSFSKAVRDAVNLQFYAKLRPFKGLVIEQRVSALRNNTNIRDWNNVYDFVRLDFSDPDSYTNPQSPGRQYAFGQPAARNLEMVSRTDQSIRTFTTINYDFQLSDHNFNTLLGFQSEDITNRDQFSAARTGFLLDNILNLSTGDEPGYNGLGNASIIDTPEKFLSYFGRLSYNYRGGKYNAELTFRYDGSSNFLADNRWELFPALAVGWNIAEEAFLMDATFIDQFKLRASYGQSGDATGVGNRIIQLVNLNTSGYALGGVISPSLSLASPAGRNLQWETSTILNTGVDFSLWAGKLQANVDYFINDRENILALQQVPLEFGFGNVPANAYSVRSWGWELELTHQNKIGNDFKYWISSNISNYDNEITDLAGIEQPDLQVGQSVNDRFGYVTDGFFNSEAEIAAYVGEDGQPIDQSDVNGSYVGGFKFVDQVTDLDTDGDGIPDTRGRDGIITPDDRVVLERNSASNLAFGTNLGASYKGFNFSASIYGFLDNNQWWNSADAHEPFLNGTNAFEYQLDYWRPDNTNALFPVPQGNGIQNYRSNISHLLHDNEFIKLQNVTFSYDFNSAFLDKLRIIKSLRAVVSVENIGVLWTNSPLHDYGWDPEFGPAFVDYPLPIVTSFGLNVKL